MDNVWAMPLCGVSTSSWRRWTVRSFLLNETVSDVRRCGYGIEFVKVCVTESVSRVPRDSEMTLATLGIFMIVPTRFHRISRASDKRKLLGILLICECSCCQNDLNDFLMQVYWCRILCLQHCLGTRCVAVRRGMVRNLVSRETEGIVSSCLVWVASIPLCK